MKQEANPCKWFDHHINHQAKDGFLRRPSLYWYSSSICCKENKMISLWALSNASFQNKPKSCRTSHVKMVNKQISVDKLPFLLKVKTKGCTRKIVRRLGKQNCLWCKRLEDIRALWPISAIKSNCRVENGWNTAFWEDN